MLRRATTCIVAECSYATRSSRAVYSARKLQAAPRRGANFVSAPILFEKLLKPSPISLRQFTTSIPNEKGRQAEGSETESDLLISVMSLMVRKRDLLIKSNTSVIDHVKAKEISDLEELYKLSKEWEQVNNVSAGVLYYTEDT
jgi:hypothetical protein